MRTWSPWSLALLLAACGGSTPKTGGDGAETGGMMDDMMMQGTDMGMDDGAIYGPLDVGAGWADFAKINAAPFHSPTHGGRQVDVYVNDIGLVAYQDPAQEAAIPVGTVVVKTSMEKSGEPGPIFVMEKREAGFNPEHGDWWYAIHWEDPPEKWRARLGGPLYWRTPSKRADYCWDCHDSFERELGGVPSEQAE